MTIQGGNFAAQSPVTSVRFSPGVAASFQILSGLRIRAIVPGGSSTGRITVSNCKGSSTSGIFTVYRQRICTVPHLIGMTIADAKDAIVDAHCAVGDIDKVTVGAPPHIYYVIKQSPSPGIQLLPLGLVNFTARG